MSDDTRTVSREALAAALRDSGTWVGVPFLPEGSIEDAADAIFAALTAPVEPAVEGVRTAAGRALLDDLADYEGAVYKGGSVIGSPLLRRVRHDSQRLNLQAIADGIAAIEAEAREGGFNDAIKRSLEAIQRDQAQEAAQPAPAAEHDWIDNGNVTGDSRTRDLRLPRTGTR